MVYDKQRFFPPTTVRDRFYCFPDNSIFPISQAAAFDYFSVKSLLMKTIILLILLTASLPSAAQGVFSNQTTAALQKVIQDYPNRFLNIRGDRIQEHDHSIEYASKVRIPGSLHCVVTEANTAAVAFGWTCNLFQTTDPQKARDKFQELFNQIRNTIIKIEGAKPFILNGDYEQPSADALQAVIQFRFVPATTQVRNLKVTLTLQYQEEWTIVLDVFETAPAETAVAAP